MTPTEKSENCDCCGFETKKLKFYEWCTLTNKRDNLGRWLCDLCAGTMTSTYDEYSRQHSDQELTTLKTICYVGNAILAAIDRKGKR